MTEIGTRVCAVSHSDRDTIYIFGYGVYEGDFELTVRGVFGTPEEMRASIREAMRGHSDEEIESICKRALLNPRIRLDNGKIVWGAQCWWGPEEKTRASFGSRKVVVVDIDEVLAKLED